MFRVAWSSCGSQLHQLLPCPLPACLHRVPSIRPWLILLLLFTSQLLLLAPVPLSLLLHACMLAPLLVSLHLVRCL